MHGGRERGGPPNVVYIDCHDLGDWLACYGRPWLDTPHLDGLAAQGARFGEHIAAAPICMPSRAAIYTGMMPHQLGVTGQEALLLRDDAPPLAARFRAAGYRTVLCGRLMVLNDPAQMGFGEQLDTSREEQAATAAAFLEAAGAGGTPFLLSVSFTQCHRPFGDRSDPEVAERVEVPPYLPDTAATRRDLATLAWQIRDLDRRVGLILAALERAGLANDTLVVFTTEHGPAIARAKHTTYDSGLRTALLLRLPGVIPAGTVVDTMTSNIDLLPTLTELCGLPAPTTGGISWAPHLTAGNTHTHRPFAFSEFNWGRRSGAWYYTPSRVIRGPRYKLIRGYRRIPIYVDSGWLARYAGDHEAVQRCYAEPLPDVQLFDLHDDPYELRNRAGDPALAAIEADLSERLDRHLHATGDPILAGPVPNRVGEPDVPQWLRQPDGSYRLAPHDPADPGEFSFT
ncbi:MAG: sulfatase [Spirochaetaceae bacterium]|nr:sulfatase [Spirochaetaceae bacterium]